MVCAVLALDSDKQGRGQASTFLILVLEGGGELWTPIFCDDIICEQPLSSLACCRLLNGELIFSSVEPVEGIVPNLKFGPGIYYLSKMQHFLAQYMFKGIFRVVCVKIPKKSIFFTLVLFQANQTKHKAVISKQLIFPQIGIGIDLRSQLL